ncbi:MAG TPA: hypothetical protein ENJ29_13940 [Bacteroidetes bacterium]|nr:hypothetical protein [Bacteroidota bacterium]
MGQVVDTETAKEFIGEALEKVAAEELSAICREVEQKALWFQGKLSETHLPQLSSGEYYSLLRRVFATRRSANKIIETHPLESFRKQAMALLYGDEPVSERFRTFVAIFDDLPVHVARDLASEILHFTDPDRYWLWTRWMWDPRTKTGALPLVTTASYDFDGEDEGAVYMKIGEAIAFVHQVGDAAGFQTISREIYGTDVFLSCVYVIYVYTVLRIRMTQEFNRVMPELPEFSRRLLGVHRQVAHVEKTESLEN